MTEKKYILNKKPSNSLIYLQLNPINPKYIYFSFVEFINKKSDVFYIVSELLCYGG